MVLDGVMVLIASMCMTAMHPGYGFEKRWNDARFPFRSPKGSVEENRTVETGSSNSVEIVETNMHKGMR